MLIDAALPRSTRSLHLAFRLKEEEFAELVDEAIASLPIQFRQRMENIAVDIRPRPTRQMLTSMKLPRNTLLLGVYQGVPMTKKSVRAPWDWPERIIIFQRNVEAVCGTREEAVLQVRSTVLHEIGHHFGLTEDELRRLGPQ